MRARATHAIAELLKASPEWRSYFRGCCEAGALRLRSQARQFRDELRERDPTDAEAFALADVEDALLAIARKVLPKTPGAHWDEEYAAELCADALSRLEEHCAALSASERDTLEISAGEKYQERMHLAALANDPVAFREALAGWEASILAAMQSARRGAA
jgi:hypothetical protein